MRWIARTWGIASALLLLVFAFGGREHLRFNVGEAIAFLLFPVGVIVGFVISWWRELTGGLVTSRSAGAASSSTPQIEMNEALPE